jgi:hypothetical protein
MTAIDSPPAVLCRRIATCAAAITSRRSSVQRPKFTQCAVSLFRREAADSIELRRAAGGVGELVAGPTEILQTYSELRVDAPELEPRRASSDRATLE